MRIHFSSREGKMSCPETPGSPWPGTFIHFYTFFLQFVKSQLLKLVPLFPGIYTQVWIFSILIILLIIKGIYLAAKWIIVVFSSELYSCTIIQREVLCSGPVLWAVTTGNHFSVPSCSQRKLLIFLFGIPPHCSPDPKLGCCNCQKISQEFPIAPPISPLLILDLQLAHSQVATMWNASRYFFANNSVLCSFHFTIAHCLFGAFCRHCCIAL